jgi:hypothetical protein
MRVHRAVVRINSQSEHLKYEMLKIFEDISSLTLRYFISGESEILTTCRSGISKTH